jgi:hypothetical protein
MKKQIIITVILLIATIAVTVYYFANLNPPGLRNNQVMQSIPENAPFILEFDNEKSFYDIFKEDNLFAVLAGKQTIDDLAAVQKQILQNPLTEQYFTGQNVFISLHPVDSNKVGLLVTLAPLKDFESSAFANLANQAQASISLSTYNLGKRLIYNINIKAINKTFYLTINENNIISGSFSKQLVELVANTNTKGYKPGFIIPSDQQTANSLAYLYINYSQLNPLFIQLFKNKTDDILESFRHVSGYATLSFNYRSDALLFNGLSKIESSHQQGYLSIFNHQKTVANHLKDILPSSTAYCTSFSVSDPKLFETDLTEYQNQKGLKAERDQLFLKIKSETGIKLKTEFTNLLGNEFAILTTRYFEKFAIVAVKNGNKLKTLLSGISKMSSENAGSVEYEKLPYFLLGDAFGSFKHINFMVIDNYLIIAGSNTELNSFNELYLNRKFLSKNEKYTQFDNLLAEKSNVSFLCNFKNLLPILKRDLYDNLYTRIEQDEKAYNNFYGVSYQFSASDQNFYSNFCLKINKDSSIVKADTVGKGLVER